MEISKLCNLGPACERWLAEVGIHTAEELEAVGSVQAFLRVKQSGNTGANRMFLYAMEGALLDIDYLTMPPELKQQLCDELERVSG